MDRHRYERFVELNEFDATKYRNPSGYYDLCAWCGEQNATYGLGLGITFCILSLGLCLLPLRAYFKRYQKMRKLAALSGRV